MLPLVAFVTKAWLITHVLYPKDGPISNVGFGFGEYIRNLLADGSFKSCDLLPFSPCSMDVCTYATRMPLLPLIYVGLARVVGPTLVHVALAKALILSTLTWIAVRALVRRCAISWVSVFMLAAALFGPQVLKHASTLEYEEGTITDLMFCYAVGIGLIVFRAGNLHQSILAPALATLGLAGTMYLTKTTMLPLLVATTVLAWSVIEGKRRGWILLLLIAVAIPVAGWYVFTGSHTTRATISSSWNGENLFRGNNAESMAIYPEVSLDRVFDSDSAILDDGRRITLGKWSTKRCFRDEWEWNDYYGSLARTWITQDPVEAAWFSTHKAEAFFLDIRPVPRRTTAEPTVATYGHLERIAGSVWMVTGRAVFFLLVAYCVMDAAAGKWIALWIPVLMLAYAAPYVAVFAWQRHVVPALAAALALYAIRHSQRFVATTLPG
jgi:hypothetical protein